MTPTWPSLHHPQLMFSLWIKSRLFHSKKNFQAQSKITNLETQKYRLKKKIAEINGRVRPGRSWSQAPNKQLPLVDRERQTQKIDQLKMKINEQLTKNKQLADQIDFYRKEKALFQTIHSDLVKELQANAKYLQTRQQQFDSRSRQVCNLKKECLKSKREAIQDKKQKLQDLRDLKCFLKEFKSQNAITKQQTQLVLPAPGQPSMPVEEIAAAIQAKTQLIQNYQQQLLKYDKILQDFGKSSLDDLIEQLKFKQTSYKQRSTMVELLSFQVNELEIKYRSQKKKLLQLQFDQRKAIEKAEAHNNLKETVAELEQNLWLARKKVRKQKQEQERLVSALGQLLLRLAGEGSSSRMEVTEHNVQQALQAIQQALSELSSEILRMEQRVEQIRSESEIKLQVSRLLDESQKRQKEEVYNAERLTPGQFHQLAMGIIASRKKLQLKSEKPPKKKNL